MLIKVCGMREAGNIAAIAALKPDMMGFIFYPSSPRYAGGILPQEVNELPAEIRKVAVFVNETASGIMNTVERYNITTIQLHGSETPRMCRQLKENGMKVIKAIGVETAEDMEQCSAFEECCDMLLFDTKSRLYGGTGQRFDWTVLRNYRGSLPFLLSGGISEEDSGQIRALEHTRFVGIDLNSRFEIAPGVKDRERLEAFIGNIRKE